MPDEPVTVEMLKELHERINRWNFRNPGLLLPFRDLFEASSHPLPTSMLISVYEGYRLLNLAFWKGVGALRTDVQFDQDQYGSDLLEFGRFLRQMPIPNGDGDILDDPADALSESAKRFLSPTPSANLQGAIEKLVILIEGSWPFTRFEDLEAAEKASKAGGPMITAETWPVYRAKLLAKERLQ